MRACVRACAGVLRVFISVFGFISISVSVYLSVSPSLCRSALYIFPAISLSLPPSLSHCFLPTFLPPSLVPSRNAWKCRQMLLAMRKQSPRQRGLLVQVAKGFLQSYVCVLSDVAQRLNRVYCIRYRTCILSVCFWSRPIKAFCT